MTTFMWTTGNRATLSPMLADIRAANVDVLHSYSMTTSAAEAEMNLYLDALQAAGLKAMLNVMPLGRNLVYGRVDKTLTAGEVAVITAYAARYADHPALWGFYADDEGAAVNYPISTRQQVYDALKAGAPNANVLEAHYHIETGAYSTSCHDWYAVHAGTAYNTAYVYKYDTFPNAPDYGCISKATGLVTNRTREATMLAAFQNNLTSIRSTLESNGETDYFVLFPAFKQTTNGTMQLFAFPPAAAGGYEGGITRMWNAATNAGMNAHAGWFLWWSWPYTGGTPGEHLEGVGQPGYEAQLAEVTAVNLSLDAPAPDPDTLPAMNTLMLGAGF